MSIKVKLKRLLAEGSTKAVIEALLQLARDTGSSALENQVVIQSSRYEELSGQEAAGLLAYDDAKRTRAQINHALLSLVDRLDDSGNFVEKTIPGADQLKHAEAKKTPGIAVPLWIGGGSLAAAILLTIAYPCASGIQVICRALLGLGVGTLAWYLGGALEWNLPGGIRASGALGIFAVVYLINPAGALRGDCNKKISVTVFVHGKKGIHDLVLRQQGHVLMDIEGGEREKRAISENGEAYFQNLTVGEKVSLNVDFSEPYRALHTDSVFTIPEDGMIYLEVALENLDKVFGTVVGDDRPLPGVVVSIGKLKDTTDELGFYEISIPDALQKKEQEVSFVKDNYEFLRKRAFPQTGQALDVRMNKN